MNQAGYEFEVVVSAVSEPDSGFTNPRNMVQVVSWMKAYAVAVDQKKGTIIAADTIAWIDGQPLLKPQNREHARSMIKLLQGRVHELWTGVVVWNRPSDEQICWQERSLVRVAPLENIQIEKYLNDDGILVVEIGHNRDALLDAYPELPFTWLDVESGNEFVFLLTKEQLPD